MTLARAFAVTATASPSGADAPTAAILLALAVILASAKLGAEGRPDLLLVAVHGVVTPFALG